jgi:choline ABC transporter permease protein
MRPLWRLGWVAVLLIARPDQAIAGDSEECRAVRFGVVGFSDVAAVTALTAEVLTRLGYAPTSSTLSVPIIFSSLQTRSIDVFLGNWMPAQEGDSKPYLANGSVEVIGPNLERAKFTLAVPRYLYEAGLRDFASIKDFAAPLNGTVYGIEPGAAANRLILDMIQHDRFGLGRFKLVESSEQGMLAELERRYRAHQPIVFVGWEPHPMNLRFQIEYLAGGDRVFGPDFGGATINTVSRAGLSAECPNLGRLLHNLKFTVRGESALMEAMIDRHEAPELAARTWLQAHPESIQQWLSGVTTFDGQPSSVRVISADLTVTSPVGPITVRGFFAHGLESWLYGHKIPLGNAVAGAISLLKGHSSSLFDHISATIRAVVDDVNEALRWPPAWAFILAATALTWWLKRTWALTLFVPLALLFVLNQGYWAPMLETISLVLVATAASVAIGIPVGIAAAHHPYFSAVLRPVLDLMQTLPTFVYLIPTLVLFGLGPVPGLISTMIFAMPAPIRLTEQGIAAVPSTLKEVGHSFGATNLQLLWRIELPSAAPMILTGVTQCIMLSLSMVVVAALVGAGGLGVPVVRALGSVQVGTGFEAGLVIVLLAIVLDRISRPRD